MPGTSNAHRPPRRAARPVLRAALPHFWSSEAATDQFPAVAVPAASAGTQQAAAATREAEAEPAAPEQAAPERPAPEQAAPERPAPEQAAPEHPAPEQAAPDQAPVRQGSARQAPARQRPARQGPARQASAPQRLQRRTRRRRVVTSAVIVVVALAGLLALMLNRHVTAAAGSGKQASAGQAAVRAQAAAWVAVQVTGTATVGCDPVMCQALEARGMPAASLLELRLGAANPLLAGVIVDTPAVRGLLGGSYLGRYAPAAIARFGSGNAGISVRVVAPRGAASYLSQVRADLAARKAWAGTLLRSKNIVMPAAARALVAEGRVDPRVLIDIAGLAAQRRVSIVAFGDSAPGGTPGVALLRSAELARTGSAAYRNRTSQLHWISRLLRGQQGDYLPASIQTVSLPAGGTGLRMRFGAPSPLGLVKSARQ